MPNAVYETLFILDSNRYARDPGGVSAAVNEMLESSGASLLASRLYAEQKLAYAIEGHQKGTFWLSYYEIDTSALNEFYRKCQLSEIVVRQLTIRLDPRLVEPMVALARGERKLASDIAVVDGTDVKEVVGEPVGAGVGD